LNVSEQFNEHQRQTLEHLAVLFAAQDADIDELAKVYLQIIADHIVQLADAGFEREGRGVVLVDLPDTMHPNRRSALMYAYYLSQAKTRSSGLSWSNPGIVQALETYNPRTETLVCLTHAPKAGLYRIKRLAGATQGQTKTHPGRPVGEASSVSVRVSRIPN
jgi:hypothetical protein